MKAARKTRRSFAAALSALALAALVACGGGGAATEADQHAGHDHGSGSGGEHGGHGGGSGSGGEHAGHVESAGDGRAASTHGFTLSDISAPSEPGRPGALSFRILGPHGQPQKEFEVEQTKRMHVYVVRHDLADFDHVHPEMSPDGTWTAPLTLERPGDYRVVTEFTPKGPEGHLDHLVLGQSVTVPGPFVAQPLPPPGGVITVDGYVLHMLGAPEARRPSPLEFHVTKGGEEVTDLQPYLGSYAHLTGFREGDLAAVHMHPEQAARGGEVGGPMLRFTADFAEPGRYRLFLQFQTSGKVHTAPATIDVD